MSSQPDKSQKTEKPTERKKKKAYEKGNVARSQDVGQTVSLAVFLGWGLLGGATLPTGLMAQMRRRLMEAGQRGAELFVADQLLDVATAVMLMIAPLLAALLVFAVVAQIGQSGLHPKKKPIEIDFKRLDPVKGLKGLIDVKKLFKAGKALLKLALYSGLIALAMFPEWTGIATLAFQSPAAIVHDACDLVGTILFRALMLGIVVAVVDYGFTRYRWNKDLYMSKQEIRDEGKESEGNPEIKAKIRGKQREMSRRRMMAAVKTADVVVTNPTHYAVALSYQRDAMFAPVLVAKGHDRLAQRIKDEARKHDVPIVEDPPLARAIDRICPLGAPIPEALYRAVAEVLAYVMGRSKGGFYRPHAENDFAELQPEQPMRRR